LMDQERNINTTSSSIQSEAMSDAMSTNIQRDTKDNAFLNILMDQERNINTTSSSIQSEAMSDTMSTNIQRNTTDNAFLNILMDQGRNINTTSSSMKSEAPRSIIMEQDMNALRSSITNTQNLSAPTEMTDELRMLGFRKIPTAEEARRELKRCYSGTPFLTSDQVFQLWLKRNFPPYQKHKVPEATTSLPNLKRKRAAADVTKNGKKLKLTATSAELEEGFEEREEDVQDSEEQGALSSPTPAVRNVAQAYAIVIQEQSLPFDTYTKAQTEATYKRAYEFIVNTHRRAWAKLVSPTVTKEQAKAIALKNAQAAIKEIGGKLEIVRMAIQKDIAAAEKLNLTVKEWLVLPGKRLSWVENK